MASRLLMLAVVLAFASCGKDEEAPTARSLSETLTSHNWMLNKQILVFADGSSVDLTKITFKPCELDDVLSFGKDGIFRKADGTNICNPSGGSVFSDLNMGSWAVQDSILFMSKIFNAQQFRVSAWSNDRMTWKQSQTNYLGEKEEYVFEFKVQ